MTAAICVQDLSLRYGKRQILDGFHLQIEPGNIVGLVGRNGAGKTSLIKSIVGLTTRMRGKVSLFGLDHAELAARQKTAYLPERFRAPAGLRAVDFITASMRFFGKELEPDKLAETAADLDLDQAALGKRIGSLSKGMSQKVGLIATLLAGAPLMILDEPASGLDPRARFRLRQRLRRECDAGRTVLISSHELAELEGTVDQIAVMDKGRLLAHDRPSAIKGSSGSLEMAILDMID